MISYTDARLASQLISDEQHLNLAAWNGQVWEQLLPCAGCVIDSAHNRVIAPVRQLTEYALMGSRHATFLPLVAR